MSTTGSYFFRVNGDQTKVPLIWDPTATIRDSSYGPGYPQTVGDYRLAAVQKYGEPFRFPPAYAEPQYPAKYSLFQGMKSQPALNGFANKNGVHNGMILAPFNTNWADTYPCASEDTLVFYNDNTNHTTDLLPHSNFASVGSLGEIAGKQSKGMYFIDSLSEGDIVNITAGILAVTRILTSEKSELNSKCMDGMYVHVCQKKSGVFPDMTSTSSYFNLTQLRQTSIRTLLEKDMDGGFTWRWQYAFLSGQFVFDDSVTTWPQVCVFMPVARIRNDYYSQSWETYIRSSYLCVQ